MESPSVYTLVTQLCDELIREPGQQSWWQNGPAVCKKSNKLLKTLRAKCYGILLNKERSASFQQDEEEEMDAIALLYAHSLHLNWNKQKKQSQELDDCIRKLKERNLHTNPVIDAVLHLLLQLANSGPPRRDEHRVFTLEYTKPSKGCGVVPYHIYHPSEFEPPDTMVHVFEHGLYVPPKGQYCSSLEPGQGLPLLTRFLGSSAKGDGLKGGAKRYDIPTFPELKGLRELTIPKLSHRGDQLKNDVSSDRLSQGGSPTHIQQQPPLSLPVQVSETVWELAINTKLSKYRNWESFGERNPSRELPFLTEAEWKSTHMLWSLLRMSQLIPGEAAVILAPDSISELRVVGRQEIMTEMKYLLVGIETTSFHYKQERDAFEMMPGTCVEGITPEAFKAYMQDFLTCGTYFRRLRVLVTPNSENFRLPCDGLIFQALCESVRRYLHFYRGAVLVYRANEHHMLNLTRWLQGLKQHLQALARLCCLEDSPVHRRLPEGIGLISYLYAELENTISTEVANILCSILRSCCQVYFKFLQRWIFEGSSQDSYGEFFIQVNPRMCLSRSRAYWTSSFTLVNGAVPGFLRGIENDILQCGKSMNLLKLCNPQDPLCKVLQNGYPTIRCCLLNSEMQRLQQDCAAYERRARAVIGEPFTAAQLYRQNEEREQAFHEAVRQAQDKRLLKVKLEREAHLQQQAQQKQERLAELRQQIQLAKERRAEEKERQLREETEYLLKAQQLELEEAIRTSEEKQKLMEYYEQLSAVADKRRHLAEWRIDRLRLNDQRAEQLTSDHQQITELNFVNAGLPTLERIEEVSLLDNETMVSNDNVPTDSAITLEGGVANSTEDVTNFLNNSMVDICNNFNNANVVNNDINQNAPLVTAESDRHILDPGDDMRQLDNAVLLNQCRYGPDELILSSQLMTDNKRENRLAAQRTRAKVLGEEYGIDISLNPKKATAADQVKTDVALNRWKMLHGDVNIITGNTRLIGDNFEKGTADAEAEEISAAFSLDDGESAMSTSVSMEEGNLKVESDAEPMSTSLSLDGPKLELVPCGPSLKSGTSSGGVTPGASKASSSYNIASLTSSSSFDLSSSRFSVSGEVGTPMSTLDDTIFHRSTSSSNSHSLRDGVVPFTFWSNSRLLATLTDNIFGMQQMGGESKMSVVREESKESSLCDSQKEQTPLESCIIHEALRNSVLVPLRAQTRLVNEAVIKYFLVDLKLPDHYKSLRNYYFLLDGEFGRNLTSALFQRAAIVKRPDQLLNYNTLSSILSTALAASLTGGERNAERLSFSVQSIPEHFRMSSPDVLQCLSLEYRVSWPLNIIITSEALKKYDQIFSFLLKVRRVSWVLEQDFHRLKRVLDRRDKASIQYHHIQLWRHEMTLFVRAIQNYITSSVLQSGWMDFKKKLKNAKTLEDLYRTHVAYIKKVLFGCLLYKNSQPLQGVLLRVFQLILKFHIELGEAEWTRSTPDGPLEHPHYQTLSKMYTYYQSLAHFFYGFVLKLAEAGYERHLYELLEVLNVNNYYQEQRTSFRNASFLWLDFLQTEENAAAAAPATAMEWILQQG
ncbi:gamma-tubulin complex component 6 [Anabrus simplex]|uniref:gamma-tubulin complex component 6 n=1 Tax=Anabrus simplex TaxID=316456 RepID=UPI0035A2F930